MACGSADHALDPARRLRRPGRQRAATSTTRPLPEPRPQNVGGADIHVVENLLQLGEQQPWRSHVADHTSWFVVEFVVGNVTGGVHSESLVWSIATRCCGNRGRIGKLARQVMRAKQCSSLVTPCVQRRRCNACDLQEPVLRWSPSRLKVCIDQRECVSLLVRGRTWTVGNIDVASLEAHYAA